MIEQAELRRELGLQGGAEVLFDSRRQDPTTLQPLDARLEVGRADALARDSRRAVPQAVADEVRAKLA